MTEISEPTSKQKIILEKRIIFEKPFTNEPKTRRIRRGNTIVIRRCQEIMKHLWETSHRAAATKRNIENAIFYCAGGDYRTMRKYIGFDIYKKGLFQKRVPGYLERLRYIAKLGDGRYRLNHSIVPLDYHYRESLPPFPPSNKLVNDVASEQVLCVRSSGIEAGESERCREATASTQANKTNKTNKTNKHNTHKSNPSESIHVQGYQKDIQLTPPEKALLLLGGKPPPQVKQLFSELCPHEPP